MTAWANRQARLTERLTARMGVDVVFTRTSAGTFNARTGAVTGQTSTTLTIACRLEPEQQSHESIGAAGRKKTRSRTLTLSTADLDTFTPDKGDTATVPDTHTIGTPAAGEGTNYTVADVETILDGKALRVSLERMG